MFMTLGATYNTLLFLVHDGRCNASLAPGRVLGLATPVTLPVTLPVALPVDFHDA